MKKIVKNIFSFWLFLLLFQLVFTTELLAQKDSSRVVLTKDPLAMKEEVTYNPATNSYTIVKKIGNEIVSTEVKSFEQYWNERYKQSEDKYFKEKLESENFEKSKGLVPTLKLPGPKEGIFGSNKVEIKPTGSAELILG